MIRLTHAYIMSYISKSKGELIIGCLYIELAHLIPIWELAVG